MNSEQPSVKISPRSDKAILLVTFGSTFPGAHRTFSAMRKYFADAFDRHDVYMAFTSTMCIDRWFAKSGERFFTPDVWLEALAEAGYHHITVQSLHVIPGREYAKITEEYLPAFHVRHPETSIAVGRPLLWDDADIDAVANGLYDIFRPSLDKGEVLVLMGHGSPSAAGREANGRYVRLAHSLQRLSELIFIGTVDFEPLLLSSVLDEMAKKVPLGTPVHLAPLMSVAGDHALNDMAGMPDEDAADDEQSWMVQLQRAGYVVEASHHCHLQGLGDHPVMCALWENHLHNAVSFTSHSESDV